MDRDAIARAQRRRQALEALEFERNRATGLSEQIEEIVAETEGPRIDEEAFASMTPEDAAALRTVLQLDGEPLSEDEPLPEDDWLGPAEESSESDPDETEDDAEEEIARLQAEVAESRRRQEVLERYIEALGDRSDPGSEPVSAA
ncbi:MAG TPA: hypothetical protein VIM05_01355 [Gaiellaceae bacterium]